MNFALTKENTMWSNIKNLFGGENTATNFEELIQQGAVIVDVRSPQEFQGGHIKGAINIPLDRLENSLSKISKNKPVITCCASGMRSASAMGILKSKGYDAYNGGGWMSLNNKI
jgi:rhodanese-related sulfurtransferase